MSPQPRFFSSQVILAVFFFVVAGPFLPLLITWRWSWWQAWIYGLLGLLSFVISRALAARRHPDLLIERSRMMQQEDAMSWDKILVPMIGLGAILVPLVAGLDVRYDWSPSVNLPAKNFALAAIVAGYALSSYALIENRFFSGMVRIQTERGHKLVSRGPYAWIRHPGYSGALLTYLATPLFLDAYWSFLPAVFIAMVLVIRTSLEDQTLQAELQGYHEYALRVRYRLLPGVW